ncbi:hypothetical protein [Albidovulum sp.]|uniref:hypothetical protein n=1 Tax=Albidovulum sp. TaxID=1872424 RepID=UPI0039B9A128
MLTPALPVRATKSLWNRLFRRKPVPPGNLREIKRQLRVDLAHMPEYLRRDMGLFDD